MPPEFRLFRPSRPMFGCPSPTVDQWPAFSQSPPVGTGLPAHFARLKPGVHSRTSPAADLASIALRICRTNIRLNGTGIKQNQYNSAPTDEIHRGRQFAACCGSFMSAVVLVLFRRMRPRRIALPRPEATRKRAELSVRLALGCEHAPPSCK